MAKIILAAVTIGALAVLGMGQSNQTELIVKGRVLDFDGHPVVGASVTAGPTGPLKGVVPMTRSDAQGEFSVVVHQTGEFYVTASKPADRRMSTGNRFYYPHLVTGGVVTVIADQPAPFATVQLGPREGLLMMRVVDAQTNEPVKQLMISLCRTEAPKYCHRFSSQNKDGAHSASVPNTPFTLQMSADGYEDAYGDTAGQDGLQEMQIASETTKQITVLMRKSTGRNESLLPAPKIVSPPDGAEFWETPHPRMLTLEWSPVPEAKSYTVEVDFCDWEKPDGGKCTTGTHPLTAMWRQPPPSGIEGTKYECMFLGTQPGRWRVWAVDALGRPGAKTPWTLFFYKSELMLRPRNP
jgi:hypothetical protein